MSSFIVEERTINRIVTFLSSDPEAHWTKDQLEGAGFFGALALDVDLFAQGMIDLNCQAVAYRYDEKPEKINHAFKLEPGSIYQALKSLRCWLYQCTEGTVPESGLYKIMKEYADILALRIVDAIPQYRQAEWA